MAHYTGHTFTLTELNTIEQQKSSFLDSLNIKLDSPDLLVKDLALMLKSLEVMENLEHLPEYKDFLINVSNRSAIFVSPTEMIPNGGLDITYESTNLVQNSSFANDAFEAEMVKNSGFDVPVDISKPWANGIAYQFDRLFTEGTQIVDAYTDGLQVALAWFEATLKPNTQYKFTYDLTVNDVDWDLPSGAKNMVDMLASDTATFSEVGGGPAPRTFIASVVEDELLVRPTCSSCSNNPSITDQATCEGVGETWTVVTPEFLTSIAAMEAACTGAGSHWDAGAINDPNTQTHTLVPYHLEAREGDTIIFNNPATNILVHNAVSDDNISFASPDLSPGEDWSWVVDGYHDLYFHCTFHPLEEGRLTSTTNHRFVYSLNHGLNPGDTIKIPINYGANVALPSLSNSYNINLLMPQPCTSLGGAGNQNVVESLYHDLSISDLVSFQSGTVETDPNATVPVNVTFVGGTDANTVDAQASVVVVGGVITTLTLDSGGSGYIGQPAMYISGGGGVGATGSMIFDGSVDSITVTDAGSGYNTAPTIQLSAPYGVLVADGGTAIQAEATCTLTPTGEIDTVTITNAGTEYNDNPIVTLVGGTPTVAGAMTTTITGSITSLTLTGGGTGYGSDGTVAVGERNWEDYIITAVQKGSARVDVFFDDVNVIGHIHTGELTTAEYATIQTGTNVISMSTTDGTGSGDNSPHAHSVTYNWDPALNNGEGAMYVVGMTGSHTHGMENYYVIDGGTSIELTNFGHYHQLILDLTDEATLKASPLTGVSQDNDGTWSATGGATKIGTTNYGTSDPQHFHTVEFGCSDPANDEYLIISIDQHIHDFGRVHYPGSSQFTIGQYDFALGGDDNNPTSIALPFTDIPGYVKKERGIECDAHGVSAGDKIHYQNVYNGIHHGNTNYYVDYIIDWDHFALTETVIYPLANAQGTTPTEFNVIEQYEVVADMASFRYEVERDITNHVGDPFVSGVEVLWSRPRTVKSVNHGLTVGDVVQLPSGPQPYTPTELPGAFNNHTVVALGDGYGPTDGFEIIVDTQTSITNADPNQTTVEGAQDSPWFWSWHDMSNISYYPYQRDIAEEEALGGNEGTVGGFDLFRGGKYTFINNAWSSMGHITAPDPFTGIMQDMYMHAAGIKAITGGGWDNLVQAGMTRGLGDPNEGYHCINKNASHGLTITSGTHNPFVSLEEDPGTWVSDQPFPVCMGLSGWCEALDVTGWYYNGVDTYSACEALNPSFGDVGLPQWRNSQWIGNFSKEFTWKIPEDFGLTGADGNSGFGPFVPPGDTNLYYAVEADGGLYKFDKEGMIEGTNRTINLYRGGTYRFRVNAAGHPFYITTDDGSHFTPGAYFGEYLLGVTGSRAEEGAGVQTDPGSAFGDDASGVPKYEIIEFTVPSVAPDTLYYQCAWHASMIGMLNIIDMPVVEAGDPIVVYFHHGQDNMYTPLHILDKIQVDNGTGPDYFQVQPEPENAFPVAGTQADLLELGNLATATGPGSVPDIQAMNIELGTIQYIDPLAMIPGVGSEQFLVTNSVGGLAKVYLSVDINSRSNILLDNVSFKEVVWTETGSWQVLGGTAFTTENIPGYIEQIVTGSVVDGVTYEIQYDIVEDFKDEFGASNGTVKSALMGDTTVDGTANTTIGHYTETVVAPTNTTILRLNSTGIGKIDNISIRERVTGQNAWYMGEGWQTNNGKAYLDGSISSTTEINQTVAFDAGKLYEVKYNLQDADPTNNGMTGRLRVVLGGNPTNLIPNWNFDIIDPLQVNWTMSDATVAIANDELHFNSSVNGTAMYTMAAPLVKNARYETSIDATLETHNILNFQVGPGPTGGHSHTFQITQVDADWLQADVTRTKTFAQTDGTHAETYTHTFTLGWHVVNGWTLLSQTIPEGHEDLTLISTTLNNPTIEVLLGGVLLTTITESGIHNLDLIGEATTEYTLRVNGTGKITYAKLYEEDIPVIDAHTDGLVPNGIQTYHVRAGAYDDKIRFISEPDNNRPETNSPYYTNNGFEGSIDDVSVREIEEKWTFAPQQGASAYVDQNTEQLYTAGVGTSARGIAHINFEIVDGMNYKVSYEVDRPTDSIIKIGPSPDTDDYGSKVIVENDTNGIQDFIFKAPVTGVAYLTVSTTGNGFTYWDNVSVKTVPNLSSDEYLLLARSMNVFGVPIGGEERWKTAHLDMENADYVGQPIAGLRTLESFGESIVEDYYDVNKRSNEILNPPVVISTLSVEFGSRQVDAISPSCSNPLYLDSVACETVNGTWNALVAEFCSNGIYTNIADCTEPNGTWTSAYCSAAAWSTQGECTGEGQCYTSGGMPEPTYHNAEGLCLNAGTCSDPVYNSQITCEDNSGTWTSAGNTWQSAGNTWTPGVCTDVSYTDEASCIAPRATWTPEVPAHCTNSNFTTQVECEAPRGTWDATVVSAIAGSVIEVVGDGIDPEWSITLGGVAQETTAVSLPTKVSFIVAPSTPLGDQELVITNTDGDTATAGSLFNVRDTLRIITVTEIDPANWFILGAGFVSGGNGTVVWVELTSTPGTGPVANSPSYGFTDVNNMTLTDDQGGLASGTYDVIVENADGTQFREVSSLVIP
jgi:hypothetical protein